MSSVKSTVTLISALTILAGQPSASAAVGGISGAKLSAVNTATVPKGHMEFEPYFVFALGTQAFDGRSRSVTTGFRAQTLETGFRFTAGLHEKLEAGLVVPILFNRLHDRALDLKTEGAGLGDLPFGVKWRFFSGKKLSLALAMGATFPTGATNPAPGSVARGAGDYVPELGFIMTYDPIKNLSFDLNLGWGMAIHKSGSISAMGASVDVAVGYAIGWFQPVIELAQSLSGWSGDHSYELALFVGFTLELNKRCIVVTGGRVPLAGQNTPRDFSYSLAFTLLM